MNKPLKKTSIVISFLIIITSLSGCISPSNLGLTPDEPTKNPQNPVIVVDNNGTAYLIWNIYLSGEYYLKFVTITKDGLKVNEKKIFKNSIRFPKMIKDSVENLHLFYLGLNGLEYMKINKNGEIILNNIISTGVYTGENGAFDTSKLFDVSLDKFDNLHILWFTINFIVSYMKLNNQGKIIESEKFDKFITNITFYLKMVDFSFYTAIDNNDVIWAIWAMGGNTFNTNTDRVNGFNKTISGSAIKVGATGNIYILSGNYIKKINSNGTLVSNKSISKVSLIKNYPVVKDDDGNYIYMRDNGCIDKDNNLHIVTEKIETKVLGSGHYQSECDFHTIYYSKISSNGTILINNMVIDSDDNLDNETEDYSNQLMIIILIIAIPVVIILLIFIKFFVFKKKKKGPMIDEQRKGKKIE